MPNDLIYKIGITLIPNIGVVNGKQLIAHCGGVEAVFNETEKALSKIPNIGSVIINNIKNQKVLLRAEQELEYLLKNNIKALFYKDKDYPSRLSNCHDSPILLYYKGSTPLNKRRVVSIVGTRHASSYGKDVCEEICKHLQNYDVMVLSGLAYGIDTCAHRVCVENGVPTVGVLGHSLDTLYPAQNRKLADKMMENGGLLTEFISKTKPDRENFPKRNRIVAGMSDAVVVVESGRKGGAIITAELGNSYNRDVFAVPGRAGDEYSVGCNYLIRTNRAALIENGSNITYFMGWEKVEKQTESQQKLFIELSDEEQKVYDCVSENKEISIDRISIITCTKPSIVASVLLKLEFEGMVKALPGKLFRKI
ncbi:MAG: DNA-protecting protein DprA [Marinilabiliales bacterium]|nr:MAG: DNA-protecting protein DprA [Marinilabiliales bacterium]